MEVYGNMKVYSWEEVQDELFGSVGSPEREACDKELELMLKRHEVAKKAAATRKRNREKKLLQEMATNIIIPNTVVKENILVEV